MDKLTEEERRIYEHAREIATVALGNLIQRHDQSSMYVVGIIDECLEAAEEFDNRHLRFLELGRGPEQDDAP